MRARLLVLAAVVCAATSASVLSAQTNSIANSPPTRNVHFMDVEGSLLLNNEGQLEDGERAAEPKTSRKLATFRKSVVPARDGLMGVLERLLPYSWGVWVIFIVLITAISAHSFQWCLFLPV